jgi:hypothetical protein
VRNAVLSIMCAATLALPEGTAQKTVDQIVALVNGEVITRSDLIWSLALDPKAPDPSGQINSDILQQKLEVIIDERLIAQEAEKLPAAEVSQGEIEQAVLALKSSFQTEEEFQRRVESVGLTAERISEMMRQRILIKRFIDFRFRSFVLVSEEEVRSYYEEKLAPEIRKRGAEPPQLDKIRGDIVALLKEQKVNVEIDRWLREIRQRAEIVILAEP